jgi:2-methylcitrate dehydratase
MRGITGPPEVFEGNKGFMDAIAGKFEIDWSNENLERVTRTIVKRYNAEVHSQSSIEGILELKAEQEFAARDIEKVEVEIFDVAYNIIGGGDEGEKTHVKTKEEADHSLPYIVAAAILDGQVMPEQYYPERIVREDVQSLLRKITVRPSDDYSRRFPNEMPCKLKVRLKGGQILVKEKEDYEGFVTRPMSWQRATEKFNRLSEHYANKNLRKEIEESVANLEQLKVTDLTMLLEKIPNPVRG